MTTAAVWLGLRAAFGNLSMEAIMSCGFPRTLITIWYTESKLNTEGEATSQEFSVKDIKEYKESTSTGGLLPHKYPLCLI